MVKNRSLYPTWAWFGTGSCHPRQTDRQTDRIPIANTRSQQYLPVQLSRVKTEMNAFIHLSYGLPRSVLPGKRRKLTPPYAERQRFWMQFRMEINRSCIFHLLPNNSYCRPIRLKKRTLQDLWRATDLFNFSNDVEVTQVTSFLTTGPPTEA